MLETLDNIKENTVEQFLLSLVRPGVLYKFSKSNSRVKRTFGPTSYGFDESYVLDMADEGFRLTAIVFDRTQKWSIIGESYETDYPDDGHVFIDTDSHDNIYDCVVDYKERIENLVKLFKVD